MPVEDLVEIGGDDLVLAGLAREGVRQAHRLDELLGLAHVLVRARLCHLRGQEPRSNELLGDRRSATLARPAGAFRGGRRDRRRVKSAVRPERPVLGGGRRIEHELRDVTEADDAPILEPELSELDRAGPVVDDRRLGERQALEPGRIGEPDRQDADGRVEGQHPHEPGDRDRRHEADQERDDDASPSTARLRPRGDATCIPDGMEVRGIAAGRRPIWAHGDQRGRWAWPDGRCRSIKRRIVGVDAVLQSRDMGLHARPGPPRQR